MSWIGRSGLRPYSFRFQDGSTFFTRTFYEDTEAKAHKLAQAWALRQEVRLVEIVKEPAHA